MVTIRGRLELALLPALALLVAAAWVPAADAARRGPSCKRPRSSAIAQNRLVRVYEVRDTEGTTLHGCRRSTGRRVLLDTAFDDEYVSSSSYGNVRLAGTFVAWTSTATDVSCKASCPPNYNPTRRAIRVYDMRRRRSRSVDGYPLGAALVLSRLGAVAWASQGAGGRAVDIHASIRRGDDRVIDGGNIDARSLAIEISIISWKRDGVERFYRLR